MLQEVDVLGYYWEKAKTNYEQQIELKDTRSYLISTISTRIDLDRHAVETGRDSAKIDYYFTGPSCDSQVVLSGDGNRFAEVDLTIPDLFVAERQISLYPNDDASDYLAIELDIDSAVTDQPTGILFIDRLSGAARRVHLHYPNRSKYTCFSRSFRMTEVDGLVLTDSTWVVAARLGVLFPEHFRLETRISEIEVY